MAIEIGHRDIGSLVMLGLYAFLSAILLGSFYLKIPKCWSVRIDGTDIFGDKVFYTEQTKTCVEALERANSVSASMAGVVFLEIVPEGNPLRCP